MRLQLKYVKLLSSFAFKSNLRRYTLESLDDSPEDADDLDEGITVGAGGICFFFRPNSLC